MTPELKISGRPTSGTAANSWFKLKRWDRGRTGSTSASRNITFEYCVRQKTCNFVRTISRSGRPVDTRRRQQGSMRMGMRSKWNDMHAARCDDRCRQARDSSSKVNLGESGWTMTSTPITTLKALLRTLMVVASRACGVTRQTVRKQPSDRVEKTRERPVTVPLADTNPRSEETQTRNEQGR